MEASAWSPLEALKIKDRKWLRQLAKANDGRKALRIRPAGALRSEFRTVGNLG